jgi:hypothetical protein
MIKWKWNSNFIAKSVSVRRLETVLPLFFPCGLISVGVTCKIPFPLIHHMKFRLIQNGNGRFQVRLEGEKTER